MNKNSLIMYVLLLFALIILAAGLSSANAADVDGAVYNDTTVNTCDYKVIDSQISLHSNENTYKMNDDMEITENKFYAENNEINKSAEYNNNQINDNNESNNGRQISNTSKQASQLLLKSWTDKNIKQAPAKQSMSISTDDITCYMDDIITVEVQMDPVGVIDGVLMYSVDDDLIGTCNLQNVGTSLDIDTYGYEAGVHTIRVDYTASLNYESASATSQLTILKHPTEITDFNTQFTQDNSLEVSFKLYSDDEYITQPTVNIYHDERLIKTVTADDTSIIVELPNVYNYEILSFEYMGDYSHNYTRSDELVYVEKENLQLYLPQLKGYQSSNITSNIVISSDKTVNDGFIYLYINDALVDSYDVETSSIDVTVDLSKYLEGEYPVRVAYSGSNVYNDEEYITTLIVNKINTVTYSYNVTAYRNSLITLRAAVYNYVEDTSDGIVELFIDEDSIFTDIITNNTSVHDYIIPDTLDYGQHQITVNYYGTDRYQSSSATSTLSVNKYKTTVYLTNTSLDSHGQIILNVRLYSYDREVDDGVVNCYIDGILVSTANVEDNTTIITLPDEYAADTLYDLDLEYTGSDIFNDSTLNTTIQQNRTNTTIYISKYLSNKDILNITTYVYSKDYSQINEGIVEIYLNDTMIGICNVENNSANIEYDMTNYPTGTYTIHAKYNGTKTYSNSTNTTTINKTIIQKTIYINTQNTIKATPTQQITINANLTDYESKPIEDTIPATIKIANQTINTQFTNGKLTYTYTIPDDMIGKQTVSIQTQNTTHYKQATRNITLNVDKNNTYITSSNTITATKLENIQINATLNTNNAISNTKTPAIIKINNKTIHQGYFINGLLQYTLKLDNNYKQDQYNITIQALTTTQYKPSNKTITLNLQNRRTYIKSQNIHSQKGNKITFQATLYDALTQQTIKSEIPVVIKLNNVTIATLTTQNGKIIYTHNNNYNNQQYNITIKSATTGIYNSFEWNGQLINKKSNLEIVTQNIHAKSNTTIQIKADLLKDNTPVTQSIPVAIKINNLTITTLNITDGHINYQYKLPDNLSQKQYNISIVSGETSRYNQAYTTSKLILTKNYQQIITENIITNANKTVTIKAKLIDINSNPIKSNAKINIKIAGHTITDYNITNGIISYQYNVGNMKKGFYDILVQTGENTCYYHATSHGILEIV